MEDKIIEVFNKYRKSVDTEYNVYNCLIEEDWSNIAQELVKLCRQPAVMPSEFVFKGWADENCESPKKSGQYLCLVKWYNQDEYNYAILDYDKKTKCWEVTDSCEHILWTNLPPSPFR